MDDVPTSSADEDFVDIASVRILDLRTLGQDEIQCLARLCGDVPARLQDLVNVIVNKSIFNESAGSRRQTYDRDRVPRNRDRRLSAGSASAQLQLALEGAGHSHRDLILHICRQSHISEKGDKALYQANAVQPAGVVVGGNRSMSLKRMARATFTGRADAQSAPISSDGAVNGKGAAMEVLHRSSKKMKTKEEARRKAAEFQAAGVISIDNSEIQEELVPAKMMSSGHEEGLSFKSTPKHGGAVVTGRMNSVASKDLSSLESQMGLSGSAFMNEAEPLNFSSRSYLIKPVKGVKLRCATCSGTFANSYSLRRHTASTGHILDENLFIKVARKKRKQVVPKNTLRCSCGNTYATPYTLKRHANKKGHTAIIQDVPTIADTMRLENADDLDAPSKVQRPVKGKIQAYLSKRVWKNDTPRFKCRTCHRQFIRKKHYIRHLDTHYRKTKKKKKKMGRLIIRPPGDSSWSHEVKVKRIGRPPKHDKAVPAVINSEERAMRQKRKPGLEALNSSKRVKSHQEEEMSQRVAPVSVPPLKLATITCQECGRIFEEFSRYSGHLSMHARLRKAYVGDVNILTKKSTLLELKEGSDLGYRKLLVNETTGTFMSGLPAKLLFSSSEFVDTREG